jgi:hypothetical protein
MVEIVSLNKVRKAKARTEAAKTAQNNRVKFGRTKAEKTKDAAEHKAKSKILDGKEIPDKTDH